MFKILGLATGALAAAGTLLAVTGVPRVAGVDWQPAGMQASIAPADALLADGDDDFQPSARPSDKAHRDDAPGDTVANGETRHGNAITRALAVDGKESSDNTPAQKADQREDGGSWAAENLVDAGKTPEPVVPAASDIPSPGATADAAVLQVADRSPVEDLPVEDQWPGDTTQATGVGASDTTIADAGWARGAATPALQADPETGPAVPSLPDRSLTKTGGDGAPIEWPQTPAVGDGTPLEQTPTAIAGDRAAREPGGPAVAARWPVAREEAEGWSSPAAPDADGWEPVWAPFRSELSARGFVSRLESLTDLDYRISQIAPGLYQVAFAHIDPVARAAGVAAIEQATGLNLARVVR